MFYALFILFGATVACSHAANISPETKPNPNLNLDGRIVGGHDIDIKQVPYQVSVRELSYHICGGSIMNNKAILTAAHCFEKPYYYYNIEYGVTRCGSSNNIIWASKIIKHEWYNKNNMDYDVALIFLEKSIPLSDLAKPIPLASKNPIRWQDVRVTGWGALYENGYVSAILQSVMVTVKDNSVCIDQYRKVNKVVTDRMLCAGYYGGGKDACQADSGGPLTTANGEQQVGIVSWGWGCARPEFFGLYSSIAVLRPWIENHLKSNGRF